MPNEPIYVVESHQEVLPHWIKTSHSSVQPLILVTFDFHTDTCFPLNHYCQKHYGFARGSNETLNFKNEFFENLNMSKDDDVIKLTSFLRNDEHILAARDLGVISSALIISASCVQTHLDVYEQEQIVCFPTRSNHPSSYLDTEFLFTAIEHFRQITGVDLTKSILEHGTNPYILDIDLDYFTEIKCLEPQCAQFFKKLLSNAACITIAREPDYVIACRSEIELTADVILNRVLKFTDR